MLGFQAQVLFRLSLAGDPELMEVGFGVDWNTGPEWDVSVANDMFMTFETTFLEFMAGEYFLVEAVMQYDNGGGVSEIHSTNAPSPAALGGAALPQNCGLLIHKRTAGVGRGKNGRVYLPGVPEDQVDGRGAVDPAFVVTQQAEADQFFDTFTGTDFPLLTVNHGLVKVPGSDPPEYTDPPSLFDHVTSLTIDGTIATQRRRLRR